MPCLCAQSLAAFAATVGSVSWPSFPVPTLPVGLLPAISPPPLPTLGAPMAPSITAKIASIAKLLTTLPAVLPVPPVSLLQQPLAIHLPLSQLCASFSVAAMSLPSLPALQASLAAMAPLGSLAALLAALAGVGIDLRSGGAIPALQALLAAPQVPPSISLTSPLSTSIASLSAAVGGLPPLPTLQSLVPVLGGIPALPLPVLPALSTLAGLTTLQALIQAQLGVDPFAPGSAPMLTAALAALPLPALAALEVPPVPAIPAVPPIPDLAAPDMPDLPALALALGPLTSTQLGPLLMLVTTVSMQPMLLSMPGTCGSVCAAAMMT